MEMFPAHTTAVAAGQGVLPASADPPHVQAIWTTLQKRYAKQWPAIITHFRSAFQHLLTLQDEWFDWLGHIYMTLDMGNVHAGQFFTPWDVSVLIAQLDDPTPRVYAAIKTACQHPDNHLGAAAVLTGAACCHAPDDAESWFATRVVPAALPFLEPVTVCDPCCGSGSMLLAKASLVPRWANFYGVLRLFGQDIDETCCKMTRIHCYLFELNGFGATLYTARMQGQQQRSLIAAPRVRVTPGPFVQPHFVFE